MKFVLSNHSTQQIVTWVNYTNLEFRTIRTYVSFYFSLGPECNPVQLQKVFT